VAVVHDGVSVAHWHFGRGRTVTKGADGLETPPD
jgi:hypothetical protein